uniref:Serine/threonine-protein kinase TOR n=1 Tax=Phallusia mammillata TaxID=59560 RepID=A0A6F9DMB8_9ASCI|nr:serine/threonine-protein kinase mTOR-like [Phallusia mammillata]
MDSTVQHFVQGLKSRNEESRLSTAIVLQHYINTEVQELSSDQSTQFMSDLNTCIYEMVSSSDNNEKKGGILGIVSQVEVDEASQVQLLRFYNLLRNLFPSSDVGVMEIAAQAMGRMAACSGTYRTEYIDFQVRRSIEWLGTEKTEGKRHAAVLILREMAFSAPTIFYQQIQTFFDNIFYAVHDTKQTIRECAIEALRAALFLVVQREVKDTKHKPVWYKKCYNEAISITESTMHEKSRDERIHSSLLILLELLQICSYADDFVLGDLTPPHQFKQNGASFEKSKVSKSGKVSRLYPGLYAPSSKTQPLLPPILNGNDYNQGHAPSKSLSCCDLIAENFDDICKFVLLHRTSRNVLIQHSIMSLLPRLAAFDTEKFSVSYFNDSMTFLFSCLKKERDRSASFHAIGLMAVATGTAINQFISKIFEFVKHHLPPKDPNAKRQRNFTVEPAVFGCVAMLARSGSADTISFIHDELLQSMFNVGLNASLMQALHELNVKTPSLRQTIREGVVKTLSSVFLPKNLASGDQNVSSNVDAIDVPTIILALQTLATFKFYVNQPRKLKTPPSPFMEFCVECSSPKYLGHENKEVRLNAIATVISLMRPSIPAPCTSANQTTVYPVLSPKLAKIIGSVLNLALCDTEKQVRLQVLTMLDERFDSYSILSENLNILFVALHDEAYEVQEQAIQTIGRLSELNPAYVMPLLRKTLIQLVAELEHSGIGRNKLQAARLIGHLARNAPSVMKAYVVPTIKTLISKLQDDEQTASVSVGIMKAIGDLSEVGGSEVLGVIDQLTPIILSMLQAMTCFAKREVALITLGKVVESTGYVVKPYYKYPQLLNILLAFLKSEPSLMFRKEVMKVLGLIGTLDPYKHKINQGSVEDGSIGANERRVKKDPSSEFNVSDMLISIGTASEEFYPAVAISTLMRVLRDPLLSSHHKDVIQAVDYMFQSLGVRCVPYLSEIIPTYLATIQNCDPSIREFLFKNLGLIISTVKQHVRGFMDSIFAVIKEYWNMGSGMQSTLISLTEQIAAALASDFKLYLPQIIPYALKIFMYDDSMGKTVTLQLLHAMQVFGTNLDDYSHILLPPMLQQLRAAETPTNIRSSVLETLSKLCECIDLREYMSQIVHPLAFVLDTSPDLQQPAVKTLCAAIRQFGPRFAVFVPMIDSILLKHKIVNPTYENLVSQITKGSPRTGGDAFLWSGQEKSDEVTPNAADITVTKKSHVHTSSLQKAWIVTRQISKDDWLEWLRHLSLELLKESPSMALKACGALAKSYTPLARQLFNAAFLSCWSELDEGQQDELVHYIQLALDANDVPPEVTHTLLNLAEFMEHTDKGPLPMGDDNGIALLGETASRCRAYAKALHYKELEFHKNPTDQVIGDLININSKLGQPEAANGVLQYHINNIQLPNPQHNINVEWYERLHKWEEAKQAYHYKLRVPLVGKEGQNDKSREEQLIENKLGYMRCLDALGEWDSLYTCAEEQWYTCEGDAQKKMARLAAAAAWGLGKWGSMDEYTCMIPREHYDGSLYRAVIAIHQNHFGQAQECIAEAREILDSELTALAGESHSRAYPALVNCQLLAELEEVVQYKLMPERRPIIRQAWWDRLQGCQRQLEDWQRIIQVRSLVVSPHEDMRTLLKFASLCMKSGRQMLAHKTLVKLLEMDPEMDPSKPLPTTYPYVSFAYIKHVWKQHKKEEALAQMHKFVASIQNVPHTLSDPEQRSELKHLLSRCYLKCGEWQQDVYGINEKTIPNIIKYHMLSTEHDRSWYKAWHSWAVVNFECVLFYKNKMDTPSDVSTRSGVEKDDESSLDSESEVSDLEMETKKDLSVHDCISTILKYAVPSVQGFFRSIALSQGNSLQDTLRVLTLWFEYGHWQDLNEVLVEGIKSIQIENWLQVIPQLIARIDTPRSLVSHINHQLLADIGKHHPQALIYPLAVASKSAIVQRNQAANKILNKMCDHSNNLVQQAILVSEELIRVAILWHELWHEGLEEASRLYFGERDVRAMLATLEPLHLLLEKGPQTLKEISFNQAYGRDLQEAQEWCRKFMQSGNIKDLNQAWDLYYHVFRRISKQLPQLTTIELQYVSPKLMVCKDLELAVPGTYDPHRPIVRIRSIQHTLQVITSKQRPRKLSIKGGNGKDYTFLLKGHEDLRQDERVMQLFGLVNALLATDQACSRKNLSIQRFSVVPLSTNSGLIGWVPNCDTLHALIRDYRDKKKILLNIEHRIMLRMAPDYDHLSLMQKVEVFEHAINNTAGDDLSKLLWLKSPTSEAWFDRRTNYTRSLAVMSMVGHVLGLGDRHPSNLMLDRVSGKVLHIDFGDCFEVAMAREKFPEKIPFRLTRMLTNAMEVTGIEGNYKHTCHIVMDVLRQHRESVMAVLEAFVYDPLLNWRLVDSNAEHSTRGSETPIQEPPPLPLQTPGDSNTTYRPEVLNKKALTIVKRVRDKLTGCDFSSEPMDIPSQVELLIAQATSHENLCQCYIGWCPFW